MTTAEPRERRSYDSPIRRARAAETRERIIGAGVALLRDRAIWNFDVLTVRAVAERAGVNERTVYRHFAGERELRDAVFARLEGESGLVLEGLRLEDLQDFTTRVLEYASSFPLEPRVTRDSTQVAAHDRQRDALMRALEECRPGWPDRDRRIAAAVLDVLWSVASYERLVAGWGLDAGDAITGATWAIGLVEAAIRGGRPPVSEPEEGAGGPEAAAGT